MPFAQIKNWAEFQHYRDRSPPWIKLHRCLVDDFDYARLPIASKALAPMLWLLASETNDGKVRIDPEWVAFRLHCDIADVRAGLTPLISAGFLIVDSGALAEGMQPDCLEREREAETETEICASAKAESPKTEAIPYREIVDLFNRTMANLPKVREVNASRKTAIRAAWQESATRRSLDFWRCYFEECADDAFLNGTGPYTAPHENWRPDFDHLLKRKTLTKVYERAMDRMERSA